MGGTRVETKMFVSIFRENYFNISAQIVCETIYQNHENWRENRGENFREN